MEILLFGVAAVFGVVWVWISVSQKLKGDRHQRRARALASVGNWEQASLSYKLAIISRLDSAEKLRELVTELSQLYRSHGHDVDLGHLHECPGVIKNLGAGTGNQKKKNELMVRLHTETQRFLDSLPGPSIPDKQ
jgi:hypothetical protein